MGVRLSREPLSTLCSWEQGSVQLHHGMGRKEGGKNKMRMCACVCVCVCVQGGAQEGTLVCQFAPMFRGQGSRCGSILLSPQITTF